MTAAQGGGSAAPAGRRIVEFGYDPDPAEPGWYLWGPRGRGYFNALFGPARVRPLGAGRALVRIVPGEELTSAIGPLHGGALMGFLDIALFAGARGCGIDNQGRAVTLDFATQFLAPAHHGVALDAEVEVLRETGRLLFLRGIVVQADERIAAFSATVRKFAKPA